MITNAVSKDYKYSSEYEVNKVNGDSLDLGQSNEPGLKSRVEIMSRGNAFITVKDTKPSFPSKVEVRVIYPSKPQTDKISKVKLQYKNSEI